MPPFTHQIDQRPAILPLLDVANLELGHLRRTEAAAEKNGTDRPIAPTLQCLFVRRPQGPCTDLQSANFPNARRVSLLL